MHLDLREGGLVCTDCHRAAKEREQRLTYAPPPGQTLAELQPPLAQAQCRWMQHALTVGASGWIDTPEAYAPVALLRQYVELRLETPVKAGKMVPF